MQPLVTVICAVYNHGPYIEKALRGILMQQTDFDFEVLVGEDCSGDNSREILKKYEAAYPGRFTVFYRETNMGPAANFRDLFARARGRYITILETDDYWISPRKLQSQAEFLEAHSEYNAVSHRCIMVDENDRCHSLAYPECSDGEYTLRHFKRNILPGQNAACMFRNYILDNTIRAELVTDPKYDLGPGDKRRVFALAAGGKIYCSGEFMSAYRYVKASGTSYSAGRKYDAQKDVAYYQGFAEFARETVNTRESIYTAEAVLVRRVLMHLRNRQLDRAEVKKIFSGLCTPILLCLWDYLCYSAGYTFNKKTGRGTYFRTISSKEREKRQKLIDEADVRMREAGK